MKWIRICYLQKNVFGKPLSLIRWGSYLPGDAFDDFLLYPIANVVNIHAISPYHLSQCDGQIVACLKQHFPIKDAQPTWLRVLISLKT